MVQRLLNFSTGGFYRYICIFNLFKLELCSPFLPFSMTKAELL